MKNTQTLEAMENALRKNNIDVFYMSNKEIKSYGKNSCWYDRDNNEYLPSGYYAWQCFPGCLPEGEPIFCHEIDTLKAIEKAFDLFSIE